MPGVGPCRVWGRTAIFGWSFAFVIGRLGEFVSCVRKKCLFQGLDTSGPVQKNVSFWEILERKRRMARLCRRLAHERLMPSWRPAALSD